MVSSSLSEGIQSYGSGFRVDITAENDFTDNLQTARKRTTSQVEYAFHHGEEQVIRAPPGTGKTYSAIQQATEQKRTVILALQTYELADEKAQEACSEHGAEVLTIKSAHQTCPCYTGEYGAELATELKQCSITPGRLHKISHAIESGGLPCTHGGCPYMAQFSRDFDSYDLIVTTQGMLHATSLIEGRDVVIDEFSKDTYITEISRPRQVVNHYLKFINSPLGVWGGARGTDGLGEISSHNLQAIEYRTAWEKECIQHAGDDSPRTHRHAEFLVQALVHGTRFGQQTHYQVNSRTEVLITAGSAKILQRPEFEAAHSVVGLDATASERLWRKFCHSEMEVIETVDDQEKALLWEQSGGEIAVLGEYAHHASGGNISVKPAEEVQTLLEYTHGTTYTFSTKTVKDTTSLEVDGYYGKDDRGTNSFGDADALLLVGAPHPGDRAIIETAAWFEENVVPPERTDPSEMGVNLSYGSELADEIFSQFRENRIEQAIFRGNRMEGGGLTVLSTTACLPEWMPVEDEMPMPREPGSKEQAVLDSLVELESATTRRVEEHVNSENDSVDSVSSRHVRRTLRKFVRVGIVTVGKHPDDGRKPVYEYGDLSISDIPGNLSDMVRSEPHNGNWPIDSASIRQTVEELLQLSWSELDWAEWIARQGGSGQNSVTQVT